MKFTFLSKVRLCLLHGICDLSYLNEYVATSTEAPSSTTPAAAAATTAPAATTAAAPPRSSTAARRHRALLQAQIERCIQTPLHCNTNMVVTEQTRAAARNDREIRVGGTDRNGLIATLSTTTSPPVTKGELSVKGWSTAGGVMSFELKL